MSLSGDADGILPPRPEWLMGEPDILAALNAFFDKLDNTPAEQRARMPTLRLNKKLTPTLYQHDSASDTTWTLFKELAGVVFDICPDTKRGPYEPEYTNAQLRFLPMGEAIARAWLNRPQKTRYQDEWTQAVTSKTSLFGNRVDVLLNNPIRIAGKTIDEVVDAFAKLSSFAECNLTLRQLSAKVFWGHSKVLDGREELIRAVFPSLQVAPRPVLVHVRLPVEVKDVLFIENLDSYLQAVNQPTTPNAALIYTSGFKGSAERIRQMDGASLHYHLSTGYNESATKKFERWWFGGEPLNGNLWFWGDLDFSGMAILKILRQRFGDVRAWPDGYAPLVKLIRDGGGHTPDAADKAEQTDPGWTGCNYADSELLPLIRNTCSFADQELV